LHEFQSEKAGDASPLSKKVGDAVPRFPPSHYTPGGVGVVCLQSVDEGWHVWATIVERVRRRTVEARRHEAAVDRRAGGRDRLLHIRRRNDHARARVRLRGRHAVADQSPTRPSHPALPQYVMCRISKAPAKGASPIPN